MENDCVLGDWKIRGLFFLRGKGLQIKKASSFLFMFLFFGLGLLGAGLFPSTLYAQDTSTRTDTSLPDHIAIQVENETVPMDVFERRVENLFSKYKEKADKKGQEYDPEKVRDRLRRKIKNTIVSRLVVSYHAERSDVSVSDERVQKTIDRAIENADSREAYLEKLEKQGSSLEETRDAIRKEMLKKKYIRENMAEVTVTDTAIQEVYLNNKDTFQGMSGKRAYRYIKKRIRREKENRASKAFVAQLKRKSDIRLHPVLMLFIFIL